MPTEKIIIVFDLGPGDGGKGGIVHKLCHHHRAHTVIKVGGAQGSHGVVTKRYKFAFSHWGCGTFEGVKTHITPLMIINPEGLLYEADGLRYWGLPEAFDLLTVDERALCSTPYHGIASRLKELARKSNPRGTIGTGVGEAYRDSTKCPELAIRARDLAGDLRPKLSQLRDYQIAELDEIINGEFLEADQEAVADEVDLLQDDGFLDYSVACFLTAGQRLNVVDPDHLKCKVFDEDGVAVVESSHGVLTDNQYGFRPHVSAIRTLPSFLEKMLVGAGFDGEITKMGVHRAYTIRHGAGPMPTADPTMAEDLLPDSHKQVNRYQGEVRVGPLDLVLLRYAIEVCGGPGAIDGLAITWFDQIVRNGVWHICGRYDQYAREFFVADGHIRKFNGDPAGLGEYQHGLCSSLFACKPKVSSIDLPSSREGQYRLCDRELHEKLGIPVHLVSFGPTERDKLLEEKS